MIGFSLFPLTGFSSLVFPKHLWITENEHTQQIHRVVANLALRRGPLEAIFTHTASVSSSHSILHTLIHITTCTW